MIKCESNETTRIRLSGQSWLSANRNTGSSAILFIQTRPSKTTIRQCECASWSEFSQNTYVRGSHISDQISNKKNVKWHRIMNTTNENK